MAKVICVKTFSEQGLYIVPGAVEIADGLSDYLLSNYPAYFEPFRQDSGQSEPEPEPDVADVDVVDVGVVDVGVVTEPEPDEEPEQLDIPAPKDIPEPPADKMVRKPKRRKIGGRA